MCHNGLSSSMDYSNRMTGLYGICSPAMERNDLRQGNGGTMTVTSVPKGAKRRCESQGQERHQGEPAKMNTELIPKHNNLIGHSLSYP